MGSIVGYPGLAWLVMRCTNAPPTSFTGHVLKAIWKHGCLGLRAVVRYARSPDSPPDRVENALKWLPVIVGILRRDPELTADKIRAIEAHVAVLDIAR